jgi:hypothetical protein
MKWLPNLIAVGVLGVVVLVCGTLLTVAALWIVAWFQVYQSLKP